MPNNKMHYIMTSITLGIIAASSGLLIGLTNLATAKQIDINKEKKINAGITAIFGENAEISTRSELKNNKYTNYVYKVKIEGESINKIALRTSGSNSYGKITLLIGLAEYTLPDTDITEFVFQSTYVIEDEQTYASTLEDKYIDLINSKDTNGRDYKDVSCGATYGAKLVRDMIDEAKEVANKEFRKG